MKKYIFIIGAAKAGTTKLASMLDFHHEICLSSPKESDYFGKRMFQSKNFEWYDSLFDDRGQDGNFRLDASTVYTAGWRGTSLDVAERIHDFQADAQIIYVVRDPVKRAWSSYWHSFRTGAESRSPEEALADISSHHIQASLYNKRITEYLSFFSETNVRVVQFEDFIKAPGAMTNKLYETLGLQPLVFPEHLLTAEVNASYAWSTGFSMARYLPLGYVKFLNKTVKALAPKSLHKKIKANMTDAIPEMTQSQQALINDLVEADYRQFQNDCAHLKVKVDELDDACPSFNST